MIAMRLPLLPALFVLCFHAIASAAGVGDYGAIGDGLADDTDAIQAAVDSEEGGVSFGKGIYRLTKTITIKLDDQGPISLVGEGIARVVMAAAGPAFHFIGTHGGTADPASVKHEVFDHQLMPM